MNAWDRIVHQLQPSVNPENFQNWLAPAQFSHIDGRSLYVSVPNESARQWLETEYLQRILDTARQLAMDFHAVVFLPGSTASPPGALATQVRFDFDQAPALNPKYTFDAFVVGSCNQFAHAAARAVATNPSRASAKAVRVRLQAIRRCSAPKATASGSCWSGRRSGTRC